MMRRQSRLGLARRIAFRSCAAQRNLDDTTARVQHARRTISTAGDRAWLSKATKRRPGNGCAAPAGHQP